MVPLVVLTVILGISNGYSSFWPLVSIPLAMQERGKTDSANSYDIKVIGGL